MANTPVPSSLPVAPRPDDDARERVVAVLTRAAGSGALTMEEFETRMEAVYRATSHEALRALTADVDGAAPPRSDIIQAPQLLRTIFSSVSGSRLSAQSQSMEITARFGSIDDTSIDLMPRRLVLNASFGNIELDLRYAVFPEGITELDVSGLCGNIELTLPLGVTIDNTVGTLLGTVEVREKQRRGGAANLPVVRGAAYVRLTGSLTLSSVEVRLVPV